MRRKISSSKLYFYLNFIKIKVGEIIKSPTLRDMDIEFLNVVEEAHRKNKSLILNKNKKRIW